MYFLVESKKTINIVRNVKKNGLKLPVLINYLNLNNVKLVECQDDIKELGLYCVPQGLDKYHIIENKKQNDGFILYGEYYTEYKYSLEFVFYKMIKDKKAVICNSIKP